MSTLSRANTVTSSQCHFSTPCCRLLLPHFTDKLGADLLPANVVSFLHQHVLHPHAPVQILKRQAVVNWQKAVNILYPFAMPLISRVLDALQSSSDVVVLIFALIALIVVWQILASITRVVAWWANMAVRLLLWAVVAGVAAVVYQRGADATLKDLAWLYGVTTAVSIYVRDMVLHFWNAYETQSQINSARQYGTKKGYGKSRSRKGGR
jgi:hypothetical protein